MRLPARDVQGTCLNRLLGRRLRFVIETIYYSGQFVLSVHPQLRRSIESSKPFAQHASTGFFVFGLYIELIKVYISGTPFNSVPSLRKSH